MYVTSGKLLYSEVKGLHRVDEAWTIGLPEFADTRFFLAPQPTQEAGSCLLNGWLTVEPGYMWDGSSGPTIDGKADPVPSLVHDTLAEAHRQGKLRWQQIKCDNLYYSLLRERGMSLPRAGLRRLGLALVGWTAFRRQKSTEYPHKAAR